MVVSHIEAAENLKAPTRKVQKCPAVFTATSYCHVPQVPSQEPCKKWGFPFFLLFYVAGTSVSEDLGSRLFVDLLPEVPFPLRSPSRAACPCSFVSQCGFAVHVGQQKTFTISLAQALHIYTELAALTLGWSQCHKQSPHKPALNLCLAERISRPLFHK